MPFDVIRLTSMYKKRHKLLINNDYSDDKRIRVGKKFFIYAPPTAGRRSKKTGNLLSKRTARIVPPYSSAPTWKCSVFYFWFEFLKRHEGYKDCCERNGAGRYKRLYADWGNIHAYETEDFWKWWSQKLEDGQRRGERLFAEPAARRIEEVSLLNRQTDDELVIRIPLEVRTTHLVKNFRKFLKDNEDKVAAARRKSRALYPVSTSVRLSSLYQTLCVYDAYSEHKQTKKKYEIADIAGIYVNEVVDGATIAMLKKMDTYYGDVQRVVRTRKTQAVNRYLAAAEGYITNASKGVFSPKI